MEHMDLIKMTPDPKKVHAAKTSEDKENNSSLNKSGLLDNEVCMLKIKDWKGFQFYSLRNKGLVHKKYSTFTDFQMGRQNIGHNF